VLYLGCATALQKPIAGATAMSVGGQPRHFGPLPVTSGLPLPTDMVGPPRHVGFVPILLQKSAVIDDVVQPFHLG
jgi:hypothetical protein